MILWIIKEISTLNIESYTLLFLDIYYIIWKRKMPLRKSSSFFEHNLEDIYRNQKLLCSKIKIFLNILK